MLRAGISALVSRSPSDRPGTGISVCSHLTDLTIPRDVAKQTLIVAWALYRRESDKWINTGISGERVSVRAAILAGLKIDSDGSAVEARDLQKFARNFLLLVTNPVDTACADGWDPPPYPTKAKERSAAVEYIVSQVSMGRHVKLRGVKGALYVHCENVLVARMLPSSVGPTNKIDAPWVLSTHPQYGKIVDSWPFAIISASGWQTREQLAQQPHPGAFWPVVCAEKYAGHTGIQQVARLQVDWEQV